MKRILILLLLAVCTALQALPSTILEQLTKTEDIVDIKPLMAHSFFRESYQLMIRQPLDHDHPDKGSFLQRVFVSLREPGAPVVLVTEGYLASYGTNPAYINELCPLLNASQLIVEHRYFGMSVPENADWQFLTVRNAAGDHHAVVSLLKPILKGNWLNTGISKGGQTALLHRVYYPGDVDLTVSYVAPFNFGVEDGRHEKYIAGKPGSRADRRKVLSFQKEVLKRRNRLMPLFEKHIKEKSYTFNASLSEIFDYCVLEYSFSFWQWAHDPAEIPGSDASDNDIFSHFLKIASPDYFSLEGLQRIGSFFVQAARELGYYGYDTRPFRKHLSIQSAEGYLEKLFLPEGLDIDFDTSIIEKTHAFLDSTRAPMIFIYGKNDPWTASGVQVPSRENFLRIDQEGAGHRIRIEGLEPSNREQVIRRLSEYMKPRSLQPPLNAN